MWKEWWKIKALHRHFYDFYECLPRSQEGSIRLRGFVSLVFQPVLLLGCCHTIPHVLHFPTLVLGPDFGLPGTVQSSSDSLTQAHRCGLCLQAFSGRAQQLLTERMTQHLAKRKACQSRSWRDVTRDHRLDATSANCNSRSVLLRIFSPSLPDLLRLHHVLLDCNALEDLRGTRCKKEFSYSYNRNFWTWSSKMICAHISANAPVTGGVSRRPRSWAAEATGWEDIVRFWEGHIGIPWNPMRVHLGSCRNAVMQQLCSYALSLCFR